MSTFYILATVMVVIAMLIVGWPLIRTFGEQENSSRKNNLVGGLIIMLALPAAGAWFYNTVSTAYALLHVDFTVCSIKCEFP